MISPRIKGAIENLSKTVVLDVGGDPAGCRSLGRFVDAISAREYEMLLFVNTSRPFTSNANEIIVMKEMLEFTSKLQVSELVCNTNLMEFTDQELVKDGIAKIQVAAGLTGLRFDKYLLLREYASIIPSDIMGKQRELMDYTLKKPWEKLLNKGI
jgi:hypothetical protein